MSRIAWTDETWNPVHGCTKISAGCKNCYAERMSKRLAGRHGYPAAPNNFDVMLRPDRLEQPLGWKKPRRAFVCSMSDLFHEDVPNGYLDQVFGIMYQSRHHTFQLLTKRPARMLEYVKSACPNLGRFYKHIWLGVTVENQETADARRADFEAVPAALKFVSYEPALAPIDWSGWEFANQIISGGETGPGARPSPRNCHRLTRVFCVKNQIAYFFKQHGEWLHFERNWDNDGGYYYADNGRRLTIAEFVDLPHQINDGYGIARVGNKAAGNLLYGVVWQQMPEK